MSVLRDLIRRFDRTVSYIRSVFDDPHANGKASMARVCALLAMCGALYVIYWLVRFVFAKPDSVGMAGVLSGAAGMLAATVCLGLLMRKKADGSTEANDTTTVSTTVSATVSTPSVPPVPTPPPPYIGAVNP